MQIRLFCQLAQPLFGRSQFGEVSVQLPECRGDLIAVVVDPVLLSHQIRIGRGNHALHFSWLRATAGLTVDHSTTARLPPAFSGPRLAVHPDRTFRLLAFRHHVAQAASIHISHRR